MNDGILEIIITGSVTAMNVSTVQREIDALRNKICDRLLVDIRAANQHSGYTDLLYHVRLPANPKGRTAIVDLPANEHNKPFFENAVLHTGLKVKWFSNIETARQWLKSDEKTDLNVYLYPDS